MNQVVYEREFTPVYRRIGDPSGLLTGFVAGPITARIEREPDPLTFTDALALLDRGRKVRRRAWRADVYIWFPNPLESRFVLLNGRNGPIRWSPYAEDFGAVDWEEVP